MEKPRSIRSLDDLHQIIAGSAPPLEKASPTKNSLQSLITLLVGFEKKGRRGSGVTVVSGFHHTKDDLFELARDLKALCGAGGTVKDAVIEIQGDHRDKVAAELQKRGFRLKVRR